MDIDREYFTLVFKGDIGKFKKSPMVTDTPFGRPVAAGRGDAFAELFALQEAIGTLPEMDQNEIDMIVNAIKSKQ